MRHSRRSSFLAVFLAALTHAPCALGLANRVFVSARSGNDANACDNVKTPCQTFAGAVLQLNSGGEAIVLDSGGYGPVTITQSLTITAPPGVLAYIHPPSPALAVITVSATGATVVLRGLVLDGGGDANFGVDWTGSGSLHVENCSFSGFGSGGIWDETAAGSALFLKDTVVRGVPGSGGFGVWIWPAKNAGSVKASIDHCRIEDTDRSAIEVIGETGTIVEVVIHDSVLAFNGGGLFVGANPGGFVQAFADRCSFFGSGGSGIYTNNPNALVRVMRSSITNNYAGLSAYFGGAIETIGNNMVRGNGTDKDIDGASTITIRPGD